MNDPTISLKNQGFSVIPGVYTKAEIEQLTSILNASNTDKPTFRKTKDLFAIRQFLKEVPELAPVIFNQLLKEILFSLGDNYFIVKSIYFDKPPASNWFVAWHQDLTISVKSKIDIEGFGPWTVKQNQYAVQPPVQILENNFTIRIHLDDTDENNGALKVVPGSHLKGVLRAEDIIKEEISVNVPAGGAMLMKPLLMHASGRSTNNLRRRVIHIEFSNQELPASLEWSEKQEIGSRCVTHPGHA